MLQCLQFGVQLSKCFSEGRQTVGEEFGRGVVGRSRDLTEFVSAVEAQGAALLMSGDRIGGHRQGFIARL
jgi:hypothetical protein